MDPEELSFEQLASLGERPEIPEHYPPQLFGCQPQWEAVEEIVITQPTPKRPAFFEELEIGNI